MKNILITGDMGFIGSHLWQQLNEKHNLIGFDIQNYFQEDIRNKFYLNKIFKENNIDIVIHLAALAGVRGSKEYSDEYISTNIQGTQNIVDMCKKYNSKLIFFSSSSVLGGNKDETGLIEECEYNPKSLYAITKVAGELIVKDSGLDSIIIRPFTVYGENGRKDMVIYRWINQIKSDKPITLYGDGTSKRGYTNVNDIVDGVERAVDYLKDSKDNDIFHLGGSEIVKLMDLANIFMTFCNENGIKYNLVRMDKQEGDVDSSFAKTDYAGYKLGYYPEKRFEEYVLNILKKEFNK